MPFADPVVMLLEELAAFECDCLAFLLVLAESLLLLLFCGPPHGIHAGRDGKEKDKNLPSAEKTHAKTVDDQQKKG